MKHFFLIAKVTMISEKLLFSFSMATIVRKRNSFFKIAQLINQNYLWKSGVKWIKNTQEKLSLKCILCLTANDADLSISLKMHKKLSFWIFTTIFHIYIYLTGFCLYFNMFFFSEIPLIAS